MGHIYNTDVSSTGRINFTLFHEFGHYLIHRHQSPEGIRCLGRDMMDWQSEKGKIEGEANTFASFLLMLLDDFREQIANETVSMEFMRYLANRYGVSISAVILKWLVITSKRAMIVVGKDGFIDWAWSSNSLLKSGVYYRVCQEVVKLPLDSLAAKNNPLIDNIAGIMQPKGVWLGNEEVYEMTILVNQGNMIILLLIYLDVAPSRYVKKDEESELMDAFEKFQIYVTKASVFTPTKSA